MNFKEKAVESLKKAQDSDSAVTAQSYLMGAQVFATLYVGDAICTLLELIQGRTADGQASEMEFPTE